MANQKNGLASAALILAIIGLVFVLVQAFLGVSVAGLIATLCSVLMWPLAIVAIILGLIGAFGDRPKKNVAWIGVGLAVLDIVLYFVIPNLMYSV